MQVPPGSKIELYGDALYVSAPSASGLADYKLLYNEYPELREQVQMLLYDLVKRHQFTLFKNVCGRCGNSCKRPGVVMREQEIFRIRTRLGLTEEEFRRDYLDPAPSWNKGDGFIRLKNGACPLLKEGAGDTIASCSVHDIRPADCRLFVSNSPVCRKEPGRLMQELAWIQIEHGKMLVCLMDGERTELEHEQAFIDVLTAQLETTEATAEERLMRVANRASGIAREMIEEFHPARVDQQFHDNVANLRKLVSDLGCLGGLDKQSPDLLEKLWADLSHLEDLAAGRVEIPVTDLTPLKKRRGSHVHWLQLTEDSVTAYYDVPKSLRQPGQPEKIPVYLSLGYYPQLQDRVQVFMHELLTKDDESFQEKLTEGDPPCFMCGECCRAYSVEITPSDIDRLAEHLNMTPSEFVEKHTSPGRFSWNAGNRILAKSDHEQRYAGQNPRLLPLKVVGHRDRSCIFLQETELGFWQCGVYTHRPEVCRRYPSTASLCRRTNQLRHWGRQARSLVWVLIEPKEVSAMPFQTASQGGTASKFVRRKWRRLDQAARALELEVDQILDQARRELEAAAPAPV
ncbi:MAG: hypothetical protein AMXMBFR33_27400 [Candidatus Xenobia bacterium]